MTAKQYTVGQIAQLLDAQVVGDADYLITGVAPLDQAESSQISFLSNPKLKDQLDTTRAGCVLLSAEVKALAPGHAIVLSNPYLGFARVAQLFDSTPQPAAGVHQSAVVGDNVVIGKDVSIGPGCVIEADVELADGAIIGPNCVVGKASKIGKNSRLFANVSIYHRVEIGAECVLQAGVVVGSDGFGYANDKGEWVRIPQTGQVIVGDWVDIGAGACIDRGALNDTIIGDGVKIDNLCHIAHNVVIGEHSAMAAMSGIAGSTTVGKHCTFSGRTSIIGHLNIADGTHVTACTLINRSNKEPGVFSSGTGTQDNKSWRKSVARFRQLDDMAKQIKQLQKTVDKLQNK